jgi:hypothetical protein
MEEIMSVILIDKMVFSKLARTLLDWEEKRNIDNEGKYFDLYKVLKKIDRISLLEKIHKLHVQNTNTYNKRYKERNKILTINEVFEDLDHSETYALWENKANKTLMLLKSILYQIEGYEIDSFWTELEVAICKDIVYDSQEYKEAKAWLK